MSRQAEPEPHISRLQSVREEKEPITDLRLGLRDYEHRESCGVRWISSFLRAVLAFYSYLDGERQSAGLVNTLWLLSDGWLFASTAILSSRARESLL